MAPGRRASMRSVRTLPIVHEDEDVIAVSTHEAATAYPARQKQHSGIVQALPTLGADSVAENGGGSGSGSGSGSEDEDSSPPNSNQSSPSRRISNPRRYNSGSVGSVGSIGSNSSHRSHRSQYVPPPPRPHFPVAGPMGPIGPMGVAAAANYPYANPACSESSEESGITDRKLEENNSAAMRNGLPKRSQNREWFAKRGGWWRLVLTLVLLAAIAVGLGVGLKYGLQKASSAEEGGDDGGNSSAGDGGGDGGGGGGSSNSTPSNAFPAGSYTFTVALTNVSTACTTNGFAFGCAPGSDRVFSASGSPAAQNASAVTYAWVISGTTSQSTSGETTTTYSVSSASSSSSSSSSSAPSFDNVHMTLLDAGLSSERLVFNFQMDLAYVPTSDLIAAQTSSATCYFNQTAFQATLWTKQRATFPATISSVTVPANASSTFSPWPFAVAIEEVQQAAPAIPDCIDYHGNSLGNFSAATGGSSDGSSAICGCWYSNTVGSVSNGTSTR
ncbi:hypothetical protein SCUCBS95973_009274 [Sporothrix curviconia]|uniref:Tat pathway signal sequence n=1 Tax=Sporothrix curviconia TaxID=1260050 RepID=A0ABP0CTH8_9PEZI